MNDNNDPFSIEADPYYQAPVPEAKGQESLPHDCQCQQDPGTTTRRQALIAAGVLFTLPLASAAAPMVPCRQTRQKITPCKHKFCRHFGGGKDYYDR